MQTLAHQTRCFDGFRLDLKRGCLLRGTQEIKLRPKPFEALKYLVENPGRLISKTELIQVIWPDTAVTDDSLVQCMIEVRRALNDDAQQMIKTVPRRGYIFDRPVSADAPITPLTTVTEESRVHLVIEEEETNGHGVIEAQALPPDHSVGVIVAQKATNIQRLTTAIKQHKRIAGVVLLALVVGVASAVYFTRPGEAIDSIAVMPFVNVSGDPNTEYLSDGLSDSIINSLSPNLKVIALNSVLRYKEKQTDPQVVGRDLNVRAVLMGRLTQRGDDLTISVELVDVRDNRHLWGQQYNRKLTDITTLQTEIARDISYRLRLRLSGEDTKRLNKRYTEIAEAYQLYMMGRFYSRKRTKEGWEKSIGFLEQSIEKDPRYALAYVGMANTYGNLGFTGLLPPKEARLKQEWAVLKALEIDHTLAEAHVAMAHLRALDLNWSAAEEERKRALELNPHSVDAHASGNSHLFAFGRFDEALRHLKYAQELDPLSPNIYADIGLLFYFARQHDRAIEQLQKALELDPNFVPAHARLTWVYVTKGMYEEAITEQKKAIAIEDPTGRWRRTAMLGYVYAVAGKRDEAQKILSDLKELAKQRNVSPLNFALIYVGLGDRDQAFAWLNKSHEERPDSLMFIKVNPLFDSLRSDSRFIDLLRRMKFAA